MVQFSSHDLKSQQKVRYSSHGILNVHYFYTLLCTVFRNLDIFAHFLIGIEHNYKTRHYISMYSSGWQWLEKDARDKNVVPGFVIVFSTITWEHKNTVKQLKLDTVVIWMMDIWILRTFWTPDKMKSGIQTPFIAIKWSHFESVIIWKLD
jgi:hypothetical protein